MAAYRAAEWSDLFVASAGAAAALTGLLFVAVSINLDRVLGVAGLPERALETLLLLLGVLVVSLMCLAPGESQDALGWQLLVQGALWSAVIGRIALRGRPATVNPVLYAQRLVLVALGTVPFLIGGISVLEGSGGGLYWTLAGIIGAIFAAVINAWVLLIEIRR
jgi:modulator of FtsH protease